MGGYYDAGDHVKFGLPMAFTITMLSWSAIEYRQQIEEAGELQHTLEAIKWGTDYFIKAHTSPNVLWAEVLTNSRQKNLCQFQKFKDFDTLLSKETHLIIDTKKQLYQSF